MKPSRIVVAAVVLSFVQSVFASFKVVDGNGRPVRGATVTILLSATDSGSDVFGAPRIVAQTGENGSVPFDLPHVRSGTVVIDDPHYAPAVLSINGWPPPSSIVLEAGASLFGHVTGDGRTASGRGTACAILTIANQEHDQTMDVRRCTNIAADGTWTLLSLPSGNVRVDMEVPAYLPLSKTLFLPMETWSGNLDPGLRALVSVVDFRDRAFAGATIECEGAVPTATDSSGNAWVAVPTLDAKCRAWAPDGAESSSIAIQAPSTARQTLRLKQPRTATGTLLTEDGKTPAMPRITLLQEIGEVGRRATHVEAIWSDAGTFRVRLPEKGRCAFRIEATGLLPLTTDWFELSPGGGSIDLGMLALRHGAGVEGRLVRAETQAPLAGAVVTLEAQGRARIVLGRLGKATAITDGDGSFTVAGLAVGGYRMRVEWPELPTRETAVDLRDETVIPLGTIALHPGVRLSGSVLQDDRAPLRDARIELISSRLYDAEPVATASTADDGTFGPVLIAPGVYRVLLHGNDLIQDQEIEVPAGHDSMELDLRIRSTRLTGVITERGIPIAGGEVLLQRSVDRKGDLGVAVARNPGAGKELWQGKKETHFGGTVNGGGVFSIDSIPAGRMVLEYFGRSGAHAVRAIDVPDESDAKVAIEVDGWQLQGRVADLETESGLTGIVELVDETATVISRVPTRSFGDFSIERIAPGAYSLVATSDGYRTSDPVRLLIGNEAPQPVLVRLTRAAQATLDLTLKRDATTPAAGVAVSIVDAVGRQIRTLPTMGDGRLHVSGLSAGVVHVIWSDPLSGVGISPAIPLRSGQQDVMLSLQPGKDLVVHCEASDCSGTRLGSITFTSDGIDLAPFLRVGAVNYSDRGAAYLGRLAPGNYDVAADSGTFRLNKRIELCNGPGQVDLYLQR